ncbi:MAG: hypothetical protein H7840_14870 [Alphaproteobacteria bacterium]
MKLDALFGFDLGDFRTGSRDTASAAASRRGRDAAAPPGAAAASPPPAGQEEEPILLAAPDTGRDVRNMSPREVANFAYDNYMSGVLNWDEYRMLGFPAELHPAFDSTIGALTGEKAEPDRPRDVIAQWEERLDFERTHNADNPTVISRTERILDVLRWQDVPKLSLEA